MATNSGEPNIPCHECGRILKKLKRCKNCKTTFYCSRECQLKDWPAHRGKCIANCERNRKKDVSSEPNKGAESQNGDSDQTYAPQEKDMWTEEEVGLDSMSLSEVSKADESTKGVKDQERIAEPLAVTEHQHDGNGSTSSKDDAIIKDPVNITVKTSKQKHKLTLDALSSGEDLMRMVALKVCIPVSQMKLIHKGKLMSSESIRGCISQRAVFQAIGEVAESEEGLRSKDIECVMSRIKVDRNTAIKALRTTSGDVVDAILYLGNK